MVSSATNAGLSGSVFDPNYQPNSPYSVPYNLEKEEESKVGSYLYGKFEELGNLGVKLLEKDIMKSEVDNKIANQINTEDFLNQLSKEIKGSTTAPARAPAIPQWVLFAGIAAIAVVAVS